MISKRSPAAADTIEERIGPELKRLREAAGISLRTLADRAGFSPSFISQVETGQASPSIASLAQIAATLDVTLADFFAAPDSANVVVVRADARPSFRSSWSRARIDSLIPPGTGHPIEAIMVTTEPGGSSGKHAAGVTNDQLAVVFSGQLTLTLAEDTLDLETGDAVLISARTPHHWHNRKRTAAQVLFVSSRGVR